MSPARLFRSSRRLALLALALAGAATSIALQREDGQQAVHRLSRRLLRIMRIPVIAHGPIPSGGLIVANHLGYLDILVLGSLGPTVFVAKSEVRSWPVFGWFARRSGTIFVDRGRAAGAAGSGRAMAAALQGGNSVALFPEGTSSGGAAVLPFKSALLEPACGRAIWTAAFAYGLGRGEGDPAEVACYWKDMSLLPHLLRLLSRRKIRAAVVFAPFHATAMDRKTLALRLQGQVAELQVQANRLLSPRAFAQQEGSAPIVASLPRLG